MLAIESQQVAANRFRGTAVPGITKMPRTEFTSTFRDEDDTNEMRLTQNEVCCTALSQHRICVTN